MDEEKVELITTDDGSNSLVRKDLNETYHSLKGARGESQYVFINQGLNYVLGKKNQGMVNILEIGMGTGLNILLSALVMNNHESIKARIQTLEPFPISEKIWQRLNFGGPREEQDLINSIHQGSWSKEFPLTPNCSLLKKNCTIEEFESEVKFDLIYYDAFAPSKQPEIWSKTNLQKCFDHLIPAGVLVTYCAQGQFKRNLKEIGFKLEVLPGALGKKEMVRAIKP